MSDYIFEMTDEEIEEQRRHDEALRDQESEMFDEVLRLIVGLGGNRVEELDRAQQLLDELGESGARYVVALALEAAKVREPQRATVTDSFEFSF